MDTLLQASGSLTRFEQMTMLLAVIAAVVLLITGQSVADHLLGYHG